MKTIRSIFEEKISRTNSQLASLAGEADALRRRIAEIDEKAKELKSQLDFIYAWQSEVGDDDSGGSEDGPEADSSEPAPTLDEAEPEQSHSLPVDSLVVPDYVDMELLPAHNGTYSLDPALEIARLEPISREPGEPRNSESLAVEVAEQRSAVAVLTMPVQDYAVVSAYADEEACCQPRAAESTTVERKTVAPIPLEVFKQQSPAALNISDIARIIMRRVEREG